MLSVLDGAIDDCRNGRICTHEGLFHQLGKFNVVELEVDFDEGR